MAVTEFQAVQDNKRTTTSGARSTQTLKHFLTGRSVIGPYRLTANC